MTPFKKWSDRYGKVWFEMQDYIWALDAPALAAFIKEAASRTSTNCSFWEYAVSRIALDIAYSKEYALVKEAVEDGK